MMATLNVTIPNDTLAKYLTHIGTTPLDDAIAGLMGLATVEEYARAVVKSDFEQPGDEDVFRKVFEDLKGSGVAASEGEVRMKMAELLAQAREQIKGE